MFDTIIVGAGIVGSFAALHSLKFGSNVALLEQFPLPHSRGSSGGQSRITLPTISLEEEEGLMRLQSFEEWKTLEQEQGISLVRPITAVIISDDYTKEQAEKMYSSSVKNGSSPMWIEASKFNEQYRTSFPGDSSIFIEPTAAVLMAEKCLPAARSLFTARGGKLFDEWQVNEVTVSETGRIAVIGPKGHFEALKLIICAGPWSYKVLNFLRIEPPLKTRKAISYYWKVEEKTPFQNVAFVDLSVKSHAFGTPVLEYPNLLKMSSQGIYASPDERDNVDMSPNRKHVMNYAKTRLPFLSEKPVLEEGCMYTDTPDERMIIDYHPDFKNIAFACGFKGTGFKIAPIVGKLLAEMVSDDEPSIDISSFSMLRFNV